MIFISKILITGGAGFIGSHLAEHFAGENEVVVLDLFADGVKNISHIPNMDLVKGSILDPNALDTAMDGVDYVLHHAALTSVPASMENPLPTTQTNVIGTLNVLGKALEFGAKKVVLASSSAVYGNAGLPAREEACPGPLSPYATSKLANEQHAMQYVGKGLDTICLRYFNVYGPRQSPDSQYAAAVPKFMIAALRGSPTVIYGDGKQSRDFVFVRDVAKANELAMRSRANGVFNVASGKAVAISELAGKISELCGGVKTPKRNEPAREGDILHMLGSTDKAEKALGFRAETTLEKGLEETMEYFRKK